MRGRGGCVDGAPPGTSYIYCPVISFTAHRPHGNVDVRASLTRTRTRSFFLSFPHIYVCSLLPSKLFCFTFMPLIMFERPGFLYLISP